MKFFQDGSIKGDRNPVLLVHGLNDTDAVFLTMETYLLEQGWSVHSINLTPSSGASSLEELASQVEQYIDSAIAPKQSIDLVGFSMGGLVTRYYLQRLGGIERVERYINISAPNRGTLTAYLLPFPGIIQMRPNSPFLQDLNRDAAAILNQINLTVLWTPLDLMIVPSASSRLSVGKEKQLPILIHSLMLTDKRVLKVVEEALVEPLKLDHRSRLTRDHQKSLQNDDKT